MSRSFAFVAHGQLFVKDGVAPPRAHTSAFGESVRQRAIEISKKHDWKTAGRGHEFMSRGLLWGGAAKDPEAMLIAVTGLSLAPDAGNLLYALDTEGRTAICRLRLDDGVERRLLHGAERRIRDLCAEPGRDQVICTVAHPDGTSSIARMTDEATDLVELTEGEAQDSAPAWVPGPGRRVVYQSAGVGRDGAGRPTGLGPSAIHSLDLEAGQVDTLLEDRRQDYLAPRMCPDGSLLCISRPYRKPGGGGFLRSTLDFVLFPARLLFALFQYLNFFTARYTGKPLTTASGPKREGADIRQMMVWSNLMQAQQDALQGDDPAADVPSSWRLVRRSSSGELTTLASSVLDFCLYPDQTILYTTGTAIYSLDPGGRRDRLHTEAGIRQVLAL